MPPELLGSYGLTFACLIVIGVLWRKYDANDKEIRGDMAKCEAKNDAMQAQVNELTKESNYQKGKLDTLEAQGAKVALTEVVTAIREVLQELNKK